MTRILIAAAAATLAAGLAAAPASANQGAASGTIQLRGSVAKVCTVSVVDLGASLDLVAGENAKAVGTVTENCNSGAGYDITITSANQGRLRSGNELVNYNLIYDNQSNALGSAWTINRGTAQFDRRATVAVTLPANARAIAGTYADTVTIQIAGK